MRDKDQTGLSDLLALGETALNVLLGASREMKDHLADKRESVARVFDLVTRDEFDAAFAMIKKIRAAQTDLDRRLHTIEEKMTLSSPQKRTGKKTISSRK